MVKGAEGDGAEQEAEEFKGELPVGGEARRQAAPNGDQQQSGGGGANFVDVQSNGTVTLTVNAGGDLTASSVTTGNNVTLTTVAGGDVFVGSVTATGSTLTINATGMIDTAGAMARLG